ncbi:MAG: phosphate ABC transporter permease subunit PstC [Thalassobaculum sp.]|uniref:phosphate ABC transporter permease subunit PstC n=1 Tax=Thalassobaculum sp. TaxID=2022740 RepID=UPI0032F09518
MSLYLLIIVVGLPLLGFILARRRASAMVGAGAALHSLPDFHGAYVAAWTGIPSILLVVVWVAVQGPLLDQAIFATLPDAFRAAVENRGLTLAEIHSVADGRLFGEPAPEVRAAAERLNTWAALSNWAMVAVAAASAVAGLVVTRSRLSPEFRARHGVERVLSGLMVVCSTIAVLTTLGILLSLIFESIRFFAKVPWYEFLFGLNWEPQIAIRADQVAGAGAFGAVPVFLGTVVIAVIAMLVATPIGLLSAIYLTEYASPRFRAVAKPSLEILAGIPTVVYGFFAVLTVAPALRALGASVGLDVAPNSALAAGAVMGLMIIPFISSLSDDALAAVPQSLRDGSAALGATKSETITKVLLPAALPGIMGGALLAVSRAIGETMIVVMAAGLIAKMTLNPLESVTTVTVQIVTLLIGDTEFDSPKTLAAFGLGLVLFVITLSLNVLALRIVQKYRERYD